MNTTRNSQRPGLILLVVMGMLALFSMLAVTYMVFASSSRATSVALSRKDIRSNQSYKPLFEEAIKQLVRGSATNDSATYGHSLLGDIYGDRESSLRSPTIPAARQATLLTIRNFEFDPVNPLSGPTPPMTYDSPQRSMLLAPQVGSANIVNGHFLRIPLNPGGYGNPDPNFFTNPTILPMEHDVLNGRVVTFPVGNGPLSGHSFRIVRYIGRVTPFTSPTADQVMQFAQCYSITIDLLDADLTQTYAKYDIGVSGLRSLTLAEWANAIPPVAPASQAQAGVYLCYANVDDTASHLLNGGFNIFLNAAPFNSHGIGVLNNGESQAHNLPVGTGGSIDSMSTGLFPNWRLLETFGSLTTGAGSLVGDSDEPYDAPDYNNFFLSHRFSGATNAAQIVPSFHRAALINYIVNWKDPATYTEQEFLSTVRRIEMACGRPLSISLVTPMGSYSTHPTFTGSNIGGPGAIPTLAVNIPSSWSTNWGATGLPAFITWLNWLTAGPWDVDNDSDGTTDSVWVDVGLPFQTSPDGQLLKALVAYYVEDLDSKLDLNATGSYAQTGAVPPYSGAIGYTAAVNGDFARYTGTPPNDFLAQGLGYGAAESSFRHLLAKSPRFMPPFVTPAMAFQTQQNAYQTFLLARYGRNHQTLDRSPGIAPFNLANPDEGDDALSQLKFREQRNVFSHAMLPGFPLGTHGRAAYALDRLGNPRVMNVDSIWGQSYDDPYEARWLSPAFQDSPITLAEWERIYRIGDSDRTALPQRLEALFGETSSSVPTSNLRHEVAPRTAHLRAPVLATRGLMNSNIPTSFIEMVNTIRRMRDPSNPNFLDITMFDRVSYRGFASLFPLEFQRGLPMDLNRPFGNGVDDDNDGEIDEPFELFQIAQRAHFITGQRTTGNVGVPEEYLQGQMQLSPDATPKNLFDPNVVYTGTMPPQTPTVFSNNLESRQLYARHLYCLAQLIIPQNYVFPNADPSLSYTLPLSNQTQLARARILAQWAINVVDFRDADSSMTRFAYDPFPFREKSDSTTTPATSYFAWEPQAGAVVWGMEQPELLITESLATHDIRVIRNDTATPPRVDQYRLPEGSLFLEFFNPRSTEGSASQSAAGVSPALYTSTTGGRMALDLTRLAPAGSYPNGPAAVPVWRVYIGNPIDANASPVPPTPLTVYNDPARKSELTYQMVNSNIRFDTMGAPRTTPTFQTDAVMDAQNSGFVFDRSMTPVAEPDPNQARILVFASGVGAGGFVPTVDNCPGVADPESQVFVSQTANVILEGGQYLVVGPREITYFGSKKSATATAAIPVNNPNNHRIDLVPGWAQMYKSDNMDPDYSILQRPTMRNCFTMVAASAAPSTWITPPPPPPMRRPPQTIGLNVSEPLARSTGYYAVPTRVVNNTDMTGDPVNGAPGFGDMANYLYYDAYHDYNAGGPPPTRAPFDDQTSTSGPLNLWAAGNNMMSNVVNIGTQENWCTAYLQRLADPEKPWDAAFNPYITVDWMPIDLTVFSGEEDHGDVTGSAAPIKFASRQKTGQPLEQVMPGAFTYRTPATFTGTTFFSAATHAPQQATTPSVSALLNFEHELKMDEVAGTLAMPIRPTSEVNTFCTLGFLNSTYRIAGEEGTVAPGSIVGLPGDPSPSTTLNANWIPHSLYWANRQFVNPYELATVPLSSPGQLMQEFSSVPSNGGDRYLPKDNTSAFVPFNHLLSFMHEQSTRAALPAVPEIPMSTLFSWVETPSPWSDANDYVDPREAQFHSPSSVPANMAMTVASTNWVFDALRAPYNRISKFVEPGRVNLNTIAEQNVAQGVWFNTLVPNDRTTLASPSANAIWTALEVSRRGFVAGGGFYTSPAGRFNAEVPTEFASVFKPAMEAGMVPATRSPVLDAAALNAPVNTTLMRYHHNPAAGQPPGPLFRETHTQAHENALTDTLPISRLANLTTDRSNVFAVYVTIGFFNYNQATGALEQEFGAEKGEAQRYKAFYVVDRSQAVAFQTGVDHNVEKTILLRRYLKTDDRQ